MEVQQQSISTIWIEMTLKTIMQSTICTHHSAAQYQTVVSVNNAMSYLEQVCIEQLTSDRYTPVIIYIDREYLYN